MRARIYCLFTLAAASCSQAVADGQPPSITEVQQAWNARQERIGSVAITWSETELIGARTLPPPRPTNEATSFLPVEDVRVDRSAELLLQDELMRYSYEGQVYNVHKGGVRQKRYVSVCNQSVSKNLHDNLDGDRADFPLSGFIREDLTHYDFDNRNLVAVLMACRPTKPNMGGVDLSEYEIEPPFAHIHGRPCYLVRPRLGSSRRWQRVYWVDPGRDYCVVRVECGRPHALPIYTLDVDYSQQDPGAEWMPCRWKFIETGGSATRVLSQLTATVTACQLNHAISAMEFDFEFPPGAAVVDNRSGERFIARPDSERRLVTAAELQRGATYQDLVSTPSGQAAPPARGRGTESFLVLAVGIVLVVLLAAVWRSRARE